LRGSAVTVPPRSGYRHRQGMSFGGNRVDVGKLQTTYRRRFLSERNKTAVMLVCTPTSLVWPLFFLHCTLLAIEGAVLSSLKGDSRIWREIYGPVVRGIAHESGSWRARRREVQRTRAISLRRWFGPFTWWPRKLVLLRRHGLPGVR
jgi:hypothetical protein